MNHPDFRQLLNSLSYAAFECRLVLNSGPGGPTEDEVNEEFSYFLPDEGQIGDGEGQIGEDEIKESIRSRLRLDRNLQSNELFTGLGCKMDEALSFFQNRWLAGVADSKAINDLWDLLRLIEKRAIIGIKEFGGRSATLVDLERIGELVAVLLGGEPVAGELPPKDGPAIGEEPKPKKGPGGRKMKVTVKELKDYDKNIKDNKPGVTLKYLSERWRIAKSTIGGSDFWKKLREQKRSAKGNTHGAKAGKKRHAEEVEKIDERLDGG